MSFTRSVLIALLAGLALGAAAAWADRPALFAVIAGLEPIGTLWINAIRMTVIPLVVSLLITGVASVAEVTAIARIGGRAILWFLVLLVLWFLVLLGGSALLTALAAPVLLHGLVIDPAATASLRAGAAAGAEATGRGVGQLPGLIQWVTELVPTNPIGAAAEGAMLPLVIFSLLFAFALTRLPPEPRESVVRFTRAVGDAMLVLVRWIIALAPLGVFALTLPLAARLGLSVAGAVGRYLLAFVAIAGVELLALYALAALGAQVPLATFARAAFPAQTVAFTSRSSLASLPALMAGAERTLNLSRATTGLVLPLAVSTFKLGQPIGWGIGVIFLARLYGLPLEPLQLATVALASVPLSLSTPGIPSGGLLLMAPVLATVGLPVEGLGILIALDLVPDVLKTTLNVTADLTVAAITGRPGDSGEG